MKMPETNLGSFIRDLRIKSGYSQEYIANQLAISQKTISRIEQDGEGISLEKLGRIAELLELDLTELIELWMIECRSMKSVPRQSTRYDDQELHKCSQEKCSFKDKIMALVKDVEEMKRTVQIMKSTSGSIGGQ